MITDSGDVFIKEHVQSMTMREMADHLGLSKSTVSRRVARLRESGEIDDAIAQDMRRATERARDDLDGCALNSLDRLAKLDALRGRLEAEFGTSGGASLARVSSEYRKVLEEMAGISTEMEIARRSGQEVDAVTAIEVMRAVADGFPHIGGDDVRAIVEAVLVELNAREVVAFTPLSVVRLRASAMKGKSEN